VSTEYEDALAIANETIASDPDGFGTVLAREFIRQHEKMQAILTALNTVVEIRDKLKDDISAVLPDMTGYEEAWRVLRQAVGRKVTP
jgi:hypothetical protein